MKINWKVRFRNKVWLTALVMFIITTVYNALAMFDIAPAVTQDTVINVASQVLQLLTLLGMIIDPTTAGINDSAQAMTYEVPRKSR